MCTMMIARRHDRLVPLLFFISQDAGDRSSAQQFPVDAGAGRAGQTCREADGANRARCGSAWAQPGLSLGSAWAQSARPRPADPRTWPWLHPAAHPRPAPTPPGPRYEGVTVSHACSAPLLECCGLFGPELVPNFTSNPQTRSYSAN